jgi:hypothetical protein
MLPVALKARVDVIWLSRSWYEAIKGAVSKLLYSATMSLDGSGDRALWFEVVRD